MEIINCPRCGKIFTKLREPLCDECQKEEEETFQNVKKFLDDNPNSSISAVSEATGASQKKIIRFIREGRLEATQYVGGITCEKCGKPIKMGRYCEKCVIAINNDIAESFSKKEYTGPKMHTAPTPKNQSPKK